MSQARSTRGLVLSLTSAALFGIAAPAGKVLLDHFGPLQLAGLLYLGAALAMVPPVLRDRGGFAGIDRRNGSRLIGAVFLGGVVGPILLMFALERGDSGSVSLLLNLELAATAVLGSWLFREHLGLPAAVGVGGVLAASIAVSSWGGAPAFLTAALVAGACTCWALDNHFTALIDGTTPAHTTLIKGLGAGSFSLACGLLLEPWQAGPADSASMPLAAALLVGALAYGASISLYIHGAQEIGATRAQAIFGTAPFLGAALSFTVLGETLHTGHVIAALLLVPSIALLLFQHEHEHTHREIEHTHSHRHDDGHHNHVHPGLPAWTRHTHRHRHEEMRHSHPHWPDLHHRHEHE